MFSIIPWTELLKTIEIFSTVPVASLNFPDIDPVLIRIPLPFTEAALPIRWYSLAYLIGALGGYFLLGRWPSQKTYWGKKGAPMTAVQLQDFLIYVFLGVLLGGRLGYVLFYNTSLIWEKPLQVFMPWDGGMSFHGGFLGVCLAILLFARREKTEFFRLSDATALVVPIGLFCGRIANFINAELYGRASELPWAVHFPILGRDGQRLRGADGELILQEMARHPSQLYEAALEGLLLFVILQIAMRYFKALHYSGLCTGLFLLGYGLSRSVVELVRLPDSHMPEFPLGLTMGMILSIPMALIGILLIYHALKAENNEKISA